MLRIRQTWQYFVARSHSPASAAKFALPVDRIAELSSPVSANFLPAELIDHIFEQLGTNDDALQACTLVCQKWRVLAQPRLFHSIVLSTEDLGTSIEFQRFMLDSPNIRTGVREVTVHFPDLTSWPADRKLAANLMADVLELLPRPESLRLYGARFSDYRIKWSRLSNHLKNSIRTILHRPTLSNLLIDGWVLDVNLSEFNSIFSSATPSLTSISLLDISDGIWGATDMLPTPPARLPLHKLTVSNTFAKDFKLIEWLCKPESIFDLQQLKTLQVVESRDDSSVTLLASTIGPSLERLEVNLSFTPEDCVGLNQCTGLRSLSLRFGAPYTELYHSSIPWVCETLETVPVENQIEELSLSLYITHPRNTYTDVFPPPQIGRFNYARWGALGAVLSTPRFSVTLKRVTIQLIHHGIDIRGYSALAEQRLGNVSGKIMWRYMRDDSPDDP